MDGVVGFDAQASTLRRTDEADVPPAWFDDLTRKERQVLGLMVGGFHNDEIAERVCMAPQTVRNYISRIYDKLGATDRVAAVRMARAAGLF